jgi:aryl-alcohol dehydrogenase-like predicted oxidoreductase
MRKTLLGRTGLEISELALGGGVTGGILINPDEVTRYGALRRAVEAGINLQLHNHIGRSVGERLALSPAQVLQPDGVADTFDRLKEQGLSQATGITAAGDTGACLAVIDSGRFDAAQVYYNAINPSAAGGGCRRAGVARTSAASSRLAFIRTWAS